jgi:hypothetical protein
LQVGVGGNERRNPLAEQWVIIDSENADQMRLSAHSSNAIPIVKGW